MLKTLKDLSGPLGILALVAVLRGLLIGFKYDTFDIIVLLVMAAFLAFIWLGPKREKPRD
jgi:hypothetical protein